MTPDIRSLNKKAGVRIIDPIESSQFEVWTANQVTPLPSSGDRFRFPVTTTVEITTSSIRIPELTSVYLHGKDGLAGTFNSADKILSTDAPRTLEINAAPMKLYIQVPPATIQRDGNSVVIDLPSPTAVDIGVRSLHDKPATTITTSADPEGVMKAISYFGSALKTTSPERSFPTLRGHPPLVEIGDKFTAPDNIDKPDTDVHIELPADYEHVYPAASLAYYLGAEVVPGESPQLVTGSGFTYPLDAIDNYEATIGKVLRQVFLLDCVTRTEGYYEVPLHEREQLEDIIDLDFESLYHQPLAERLEAYLSIPFHRIADQIPAWPLTVDIDPEPSRVAALPFLADDLAVVRTIELNREQSSPPPAINDFYGVGNEETEPVESDFITPDQIDFASLGHAWVGELTPVRANKLTIDSLKRSLNVNPQEPPIKIHVVCNDPEMRTESTVSEYYQLNDRHQFNIELHRELSVEALEDLFTQPADFLHYIGHIDEHGLVCDNGHLDAQELSDVNTKAFLLNACESHEQGRALVEAGSLGGIITLNNIITDVATQAGTQFARLLAAGHTLRTSLYLVRKNLASGSCWMTVGDGGLSICQSETGNPFYLQVSQTDLGTYQTTVESFPSPSHGLGTAFGMFGNELRYLTGGHLVTLELGDDELDQLLECSLVPVDFDGERLWSDEISTASLN